VNDQHGFGVLIAGEYKGEPAVGESGTRCSFELDGNRTYDDLSLFSCISSLLSFPDYFGHNWNALEDCLGDMSWLPADEYTLVWRQASELLFKSPRDFFTFIDVCVSTHEFWNTQSKSFTLVIVDKYLLELATNLKSKVSVVS
jgi:RNAse (barnase) inhibitor barstar